MTPARLKLGHVCNRPELPDWKEQVFYAPMSLQNLAFRLLIKVGSDHLTSKDLPHPLMKELEVYRKLKNTREGWIVEAVQSNVERLDGEAMIDEDQFELGFAKLNPPNMGEKIHVRELQRSQTFLRITRGSNHFSQSKLLWWEDSSTYTEGHGYHRSFKFHDGKIMTQELYQWREMCRNVRCSQVPAEKFILANEDTLTVEDGSLIWSHSEIKLWCEEAKELDSMYKDLRLSWKIRARKAFK